MEYRPHAYQRYCAERIVADPALSLMLDMGLGKTVITLTAINDLKYDRWAVSRALVVAPKKVAEATWTNEAAKWDHLKHLRVVPILGSKAQRIRTLCTPGDVWVINREMVPWLVDYYRHDWPFDMVVLDEASSFKNHQAKRFKALKLVRPRIRRLVELTGTPAPNGLIDLWAQVYLLDGGQRLGKTIGQYRERYFLPDQRNRTQVWSYKPKAGSEQAVHEAIADICVSMQAADYLELPDRIDDIISVALDARARAAYLALEREMLLEVDTATITAGSAAVLSGKLLQMCNGAVYDDDHGVTPLHDCKLEVFGELLEQLHGEHALVYYVYQHDLARLQDWLAKTGLTYRAYGGDEDAQAWNRGEVDVLLAHPASCAYGLNLQQGGHHIIWFGLTWSLEQYQQANARLHRQGQERPVIVHHLVVQEARDDDVMAALQAKGDVQADLLQSLKARIDSIKTGGKNRGTE